MNAINEKIRKLREKMAENGIDAYVITKNDPHQSENSRSCWNGVKFISGFTGSAGTVVITKDKAVFWTDGRYSIQSEQELEGTEFIIYNTSDMGIKDFLVFAVDETPAEGVIGFDERTLSCVQSKTLSAMADTKKIILRGNKDLIGEIWTDRPALPTEKIFVHELRYCGMDRKEKLAIVGQAMADMGGTHYVISSTDDIAWLYNLRCVGDDNSLSFESFTVIGGEPVLFVHPQQVADVGDQLKKDGILVKDYNEVTAYLQEITSKANEDFCILYDPNKTSYALYNVLKNCNSKELEFDITTRLKAVKNSTEIENNKGVHVKDGAAVAKFIKWVKENAASGELTEYSAGLKMDELRTTIDTYLCPCFSTICGYGKNGALNHYRAKEEDSLAIKPEGFLLVDSGGNYLDGTTDITRTIALGKLTDEMIENFTLVLKCHIQLAKMTFVYGATGSNIDVIARMPLWSRYKDFKHGTGHGIGFCLNCHEGPQRIHQITNKVVLEAGMIASNEPGFYIKDNYGIRSENIIIVKERTVNEYGRFMGFETISYCPFDLDAVDPGMLDQEEKDWLNQYHQDCYDKLLPYMDDTEKDWLKEATRKI